MGEAVYSLALDLCTLKCEVKFVVMKCFFHSPHPYSSHLKMKKIILSSQYKTRQ